MNIKNYIYVLPVEENWNNNAEKLPRVWNIMMGKNLIESSIDDFFLEEVETWINY